MAAMTCFSQKIWNGLMTSTTSDIRWYLRGTISHLEFEHLEMAGMTCSFDLLINMKTILLFSPADNLWCYDSTGHNALLSKLFHHCLVFKTAQFIIHRPIQLMEGSKQERDLASLGIPFTALRAGYVYHKALCLPSLYKPLVLSLILTAFCNVTRCLPCVMLLILL